MEFKSGAVRPGENVSEGWELIKDDYWTFFAMTLVAFIIVIGASLLFGTINNLITLVITKAFGIASQNSGTAGKIAAVLPQIISSIIGIFTNIIVITVSGALYTGIYTALSRKFSGGSADFSLLFSGFKKLFPCFIFAVAMSLFQFIITVIGLGIGATVGITAFGSGILTPDGQLNPAIFGGFFAVILALVVLYIIVSIIISALTTFVYPIIAEKNLSGGEAILLSVRSSFANFGGLILLLLLLGLMSLGGVLLCGIGIFFVAPVLAAAVFSAFRNVFPAARETYNYEPPSPPTFDNRAAY